MPPMPPIGPIGILSAAPRAATLPPPVDRHDPPLATAPPLPAPAAAAGVAGVAAAGVRCQTRPAPPPLAPGPAALALLVGVAPLAGGGGVLGTALFRATRPPPPRVCGPPPPANGPGAAPPDCASRAFMRSLIDILAMPSAASSDIRASSAEFGGRRGEPKSAARNRYSRNESDLEAFPHFTLPNIQLARGRAQSPHACALAAGLTRTAAASRHAHVSRAGRLVSAARRSRLPAPARQAQAREHRPVLTHTSQSLIRATRASLLRAVRTRGAGQLRYVRSTSPGALYLRVVHHPQAPCTTSYRSSPERPPPSPRS